MVRWLDESPDTRHVLVWMIVAAAAFEFILQAVFAFRGVRVFEGVGWVFGAAAISVLAYFTERLKLSVGD